MSAILRRSLICGKRFMKFPDEMCIRDSPYTVTVYPSGEDFLAGEENLVKYDIVFLDISMKDIDGIETAMRIRSFHSGTCIVFVTAFLDYALDGYKACLLYTSCETPGKDG